MKFKIEAQRLSGLLSSLSAMPQSKALDIHSDVLLEADAGVLTITVTSGLLHYKLESPVRVESEGNAMARFVMLRKLAATFLGELELEFTDADGLILSSNGSRYRLFSDPPELFPKVDFGNEVVFGVNADVLVSALKGTDVKTGEGYRFLPQARLIELLDGHIKVVGANTQSISFVDIPNPTKFSEIELDYSVFEKRWISTAGHAIKRPMKVKDHHIFYRLMVIDEAVKVLTSQAKAEEFTCGVNDHGQLVWEWRIDEVKHSLLIAVEVAKRVNFYWRDAVRTNSDVSGCIDSSLLKLCLRRAAILATSSAMALLMKCDGDRLEVGVEVEESGTGLDSIPFQSPPFEFRVSCHTFLKGLESFDGEVILDAGRGKDQLKVYNADSSKVFTISKHGG